MKIKQYGMYGLAFIGIVALALVSCDKASDQMPTTTGNEATLVTESDDYVSAIVPRPKPPNNAPMLTWINYYRTNGVTCPDGKKYPPVRPLKLDTTLSKAAKYYSTDQAKYRFDGRSGIYPAHCTNGGTASKNPNGSYRCKSNEMPGERVAKFGYPKGVFELIATPFDFDEPRMALQQILFTNPNVAKTAERCKWFMDRRYTHVGIGRIIGGPPVGASKPQFKYAYWTMDFGPLPYSYWVKPPWED